MLPTPDVKDVDYDLVYEPSEDTFLLLDTLEEEQQYIREKFDGKVPLAVEVGVGTGIVSTFIQKYILPLSILVGIDVNPNACATMVRTMQQNMNVGVEEPRILDTVQMNLLSGFRGKCVDLLVFNPPYVPAELVPDLPKYMDDLSWLEVALDGGEDGMDVTWELLHDLDNILVPSSGVAYILFCARNKPDQVASTMQQKGWKVDTVGHRKAGWEVLSVLRFTK